MSSAKLKAMFEEATRQERRAFVAALDQLSDEVPVNAAEAAAVLAETDIDVAAALDETMAHVAKRIKDHSQ